MDYFGRVGLDIFYAGVWSPVETFLVSELAASYCVSSSGKPRTMLDVGSHVGWFSLIALASGCEVKAVEVNENFVSLLKLSYTLNGFVPSLAIYEALVGDSSTFVDGVSSSAEFADPSAPGKERTFKLTTLDSLYTPPPHPSTSLLYVKLDVEGVELPTLLSGRRSVLPNAQFLLAEVSLYAPWQTVAFEAASHAQGAGILNLLEEEGYELYKVNKGFSPALSPLPVPVGMETGTRTVMGLDGWKVYVAGLVADGKARGEAYCQFNVVARKVGGLPMPGSLLRVGAAAEEEEKEKEEEEETGFTVEETSGVSEESATSGPVYGWPPVLTPDRSAVSFGFKFLDAELALKDVRVLIGAEDIGELDRAVCQSFDLGDSECRTVTTAVEDLLVEEGWWGEGGH